MATPAKAKKKPPFIETPESLADRVEQSRTGLKTIGGHPIDAIPLSYWEDIVGDKKAFKEILESQGITKKDIKSGDVDLSERTISLDEALGIVDPKDLTAEGYQAFSNRGIITPEGTFIGATGMEALIQGTVSPESQKVISAAESQALEFIGFDPNAPISDAQRIVETERYRAGLAAQGVRGSGMAGVLESPFVQEQIRNQNIQDFQARAGVTQVGLGILQATDPTAFPQFQYNLLDDFYAKQLGQYGILINKEATGEAIRAANKAQERAFITDIVGSSVAFTTGARGGGGGGGRFNDDRGISRTYR